MVKEAVKRVVKEAVKRVVKEAVKRVANEKKFMNNLEMGISTFQDLDSRKVVSIAHNDGDGLASSAIIGKTMEYLKIPATRVIFDRSTPWDAYLDGLLLANTGVDTVFISDLGAAEKQLASYFENKPDIHLFILDHHKISSVERVDEYPDNVISMNPTRFGFDGLKEIAGSTLNYMFCEKLTTRIHRIAWLPIVGMAGDVLDNPRDYRSYNREVLEFAISEGVVSRREGISLAGGMGEKTIAGSMVLSILPFLVEVGADVDVAGKLLETCGIDKEKNVLALDAGEVDSLDAALSRDVKGDVVELESNAGLLRFPFEYNFLISIIGDFDPKRALAILDQKKPTRDDKAVYGDFIGKLVQNLAKIAGRSSRGGTFYKFFELSDAGTNQLVSDIASFTSVNKILTSEKILVIAKAKEAGKDVKLSLRCTPEFVAKRGAGIGSIIEALSAVFGGRGGGHDLAGGWFLPHENYDRFAREHKKIDGIIEKLVKK
ncbi:MAG: DHHA1 domain-containing protein [Promethearchaeota archaeon]